MRAPVREGSAPLVVGIDASRNRSGGAKAHLLGILRDSDPREHGIGQVHVWSYGALLDALPQRPWLVRHGAKALQGPLWRQVVWQRHALPREARAAGCAVLLNTDAGSVCRFRPSVVMSRDMLSYEPGEMRRYAYGRAWLRLAALRWVQTRALRQADGAIFLTRYASRVIQQATGPLPNVAVIPHGVGDEFKAVAARRRGRAPAEAPLKCLYVSNAAPYKHQWHVVRAFAALRQRGHDVHIDLVGGGSGAAQQRLDNELRLSDPRGEFVTCHPFLEPHRLPAVLADADVFVFASSCENMPNTLLEAMAAGLPIACSERGPMPEVLQDGGVRFDPEDPQSIAAAVERLLADAALRQACAARAQALAGAYSWARCGAETWQFLNRTANC
jgi:glycosyltransferase involved in cell wall biosynthesis